jgi:methionyl aminopeptidase
MEEAELGPWREASRIASRARDLGAAEAKPGLSRRMLAETIETYIRSQGAQPAFPANLSRNDEAAHYTPDPEDSAVLEAGDLLKIDVGAHLDGAISDTAITVEVGGTHRHDNLIRAVQDAVEAGIREVRPGVPVDALSRAIERAIHARGVKPVRNLTGHTIERYLLHAGKSIPNASGMSSDVLREGEFVAIEPFATNGAGEIANGEFGNILRFRADPGASLPELQAVFARFRTLPFTTRWCSPGERELLRKARKHLQTYPVFVEVGEGLVAQAEHTVYVGRDGAEVLSRSRP